MNEPSPQPTTQTQSSLSTMINNALIDTTEIQLNPSNQEFENYYIQPITTTTQTQSSLSTMINNALIDTTEIQLNPSNEDFKEQFITIESLDSNNKLLFEDSKQTNLLSVKKIPFLLPVPFP